MHEIGSSGRQKGFEFTTAGALGTSYGWRARFIGNPAGEQHVELHVSAICRLPSSSCRAELHAGNEGIVDEEDLYVLKLVIDCPDMGTADYVERPVEWCDRVPHTVRRVRIDGAHQLALTVEYT